jgi:hypothetical protein
MVSKSIDDVEGEVLRQLRAVPGVEQIPLFGVFDLHANLTEAMTRLADGLVCYRENPHVDARDTAVGAAELLSRCLATGERPRMLRRSAPIIWPPTGTGTADVPMRELEALAREIEAADPGIWPSMSSPASLSPTWPMRVWRSRWWRPATTCGDTRGRSARRCDVRARPPAPAGRDRPREGNTVAAP